MPCDKTETDAQEDRIRTYAEGQNPLLRHRKNHYSGQLLKSACQLSQRSFGTTYTRSQ